MQLVGVNPPSTIAVVGTRGGKGKVWEGRKTEEGEHVMRGTHVQPDSIHVTFPHHYTCWFCAGKTAGAKPRSLSPRQSKKETYLEKRLPHHNRMPPNHAVICPHRRMQHVPLWHTSVGKGDLPPNLE